MNKKEQRASVRGIVPADRAARSARIAEALFSSDLYREAQVIYAFCSAGQEPDTQAIVRRALRDGKQIFLPVVQGDEMRFFSYEAGDPMTRGAFGISEPVLRRTASANPDLILVPMVAFDAACNRLGHGKGYYDRYLGQSDLKTVGIAFSEFRLDTVAVEPHDVKLDVIITDREVFRK